MTVRWIVAVLAPRDVAPHPNFRSEHLDPVEAVSLLVDGRVTDYRRATAPIGGDEAGDVSGWSSRDWTLVKAAEACIMDRRAEPILELIGDIVETDPAVACSLLAVTALAYDDRLPEAVAMLEHLALRLLPDDIDLPAISSEHALHAAIVLQQLSAREIEVGHFGKLEQRERTIRALLSHVKPGRMELFPLSKGVNWNSRRSVRLIVEDIRNAAENVAINWAPRKELGGRKWERLVQKDSAVLQLKNERSLSEGLVAFLEDNFDRVLSGSDASTRHHDEDPVSRPIEAALLHVELIGDIGRARGLREELAQIRIVDEVGLAEVRHQAALRLIRHCMDRRTMQRYVTWLRRNGPVGVLADEARHLLGRPIDVLGTRGFALPVFSASAEVLGRATARAALDIALKFTSADYGPSEPGHWEIDESRTEPAWRAVAALVAPANRSTEIAQLVLDHLAVGPSPHPIQSSNYASVVRGVDWTSVSRKTRVAWRQWLASTDWNGDLRLLALSVADRLLMMDDSVYTMLREHVLASPRIDVLVPILNSHLRLRTLPDSDVLDAAVSLCAERMSARREEFSKGTFGFGGIEESTVAAAVVALDPRSRLAASLADFLTDPAAPRSAKADALDLLTAYGSASDWLVAELKEHWPGLVDSGEVFPWGEPLPVFSAALRFAARYGIIDADDVLTPWTRLASSRTAEGRVEAARFGPALAAAGSTPEWAVSLLLQLSRDDVPEVREASGYALAEMVDRTSHSAVIEGRLVELLQDEGAFVALQVLRGLRDVKGRGGDISAQLALKVSETSATHASRAVRVMAKEVEAQLRAMIQ